MSKIGDLWVRLGLKKEEYDRGMDEAKAKASGFGESLQKMKGVAVAVWATIGAAVIKTAGDFIRHSQLMGDKWAQTMSGMKAAWSTFLTSLTNWDWNSFTDKIRNAFDAARESASAHDASFEVQNSINIRKGQMQDELAQLQIMARDTRKSYAERAAAAKEYLDKVKPLYDAEVKMRQDIRNADLNEYLAMAGVSQNANNRDALEYFLTDVAPNGNLVEALRQYSKKNQGLDYQKFDQQLVDSFLKNKSYSLGATLALLAEQYQGSGDAEAKKVVDAITNLYAAEAAFNEETRRLQTTMNSAEAQGSRAGASGAPAATNTALDLARQQAEDILAAAKEAQMTEREQLRAHLEAETALLEQFGLDTTPLLVNFMKEDSALLQKEYDAMEAESRSFMNEMGNILEADIEFELPDQVMEMLDNFEAQMQRARDLVDDFSYSVVAGFTDACQEMMDQLFGLSEVNLGAVVSAMLTPLADMAIRAGEIIMAEGVATKLANEALKNFGESGAAAAAAGAALIAAGTAAKAGLSALASRGSASTATTSYGSSASSTTPTVEAMELTVHVDGRIQGSDIVLSGSNTTNEWGK